MAQLLFGTGDSVTFGSTNGSGVSTSKSFSKTSLSNMAVGDLLVMWFGSQDSNSASVITPPSGWTRYGAAKGSPSYSASRQSGMYYYPLRTQSDVDNFPATSTWTFDTTASAGRGGFVVARAVGIDLDVIEDSASTVFTNALGATSITLPGITTVNTHTLLVGGVYQHNSVGVAVPTVSSFMTGYGQYNSTAVGSTAYANTAAVLGYTELTVSGATGGQVATFSSTCTTLGGELVAFKALTTTPVVTEPTGATIAYTSATGTLSNAVVRYTSATDTLAVPTEVRPFPTGYKSVTEMLNQSMFYCAHRGGSKDWPEMSLYAYTQAGYWGVGALEVSLARTSDGVWFGLHDADINRTSGTTGLGAASTMTWAQIQNYQILGSMAANNTAQANRPYMRWEEIVAAYYSTHVLFVDIKYANSYLSEFMAMINALPGTPQERIVGKSYGVGAIFSDTMRAVGYKTWGYYYESDFTPTNNMATYQIHYDILGMDYSASQAAWDAVLAFGKPVMVHILPTATSYTTAQTKVNATATTTNAANWKGCMVSGVSAVIPRSA